MKRLLLALALLTLPLAGVATLPPALSAVATTKVTLNATTWTDLGVGPLLLTSSGNVVYAVADTTPALVAQGFPLAPNVNQVVNTASHVWVMARDTFPAYVFVSPIVGSSGGGSGGAITAGTTATSGFVANQLMYSDGSLAQAFHNGNWVNVGSVTWPITIYPVTVENGFNDHINIGTAASDYNQVSIYTGPSFYGIEIEGGPITTIHNSFFGFVTDSNEATQQPDTAITAINTATIGIRDLENAAVASAFQVYNTWSDYNNGEWGAMDWKTTPNVLIIGAQANGTGTVRAVNLVGSGLQMNGTVGVTCSGAPTASFATKNGIVTHC